MRAPPRKKGISRHRGRPHRAVFSSRSIQFPARTGVAFGLINTCRRCKQVSDPYICQERSGEWCGHGTRNLLFQESIEDEASRCFFSPFPELAENLLLLLPLSPLPRRVFKTRTLSLSKNFWREPRNHCAGRVRVDSLTVASSPPGHSAASWGRDDSSITDEKKIFAPSQTTREKSERGGGGGEGFRLENRKSV